MLRMAIGEYNCISDGKVLDYVIPKCSRCPHLPSTYLMLELIFSANLTKFISPQDFVKMCRHFVSIWTKIRTGRQKWFRKNYVITNDIKRSVTDTITYFNIARGTGGTYVTRDFVYLATTV